MGRAISSGGDRKSPQIHSMRSMSSSAASADAAAAAAEQAAQPNAYGALLSREGALGLNASTSHDATRYYVSLPSNKLELWFAMEAGRFRAPVWRVRLFVVVFF